MHERKTSKLKIAVMANVAFFALLGLGFGREYLRNLEIEREIGQMQAENDRLEADRLAAVDLISSLSSTYYLESEARTKRNMGLPGESLIVVEQASAAASDDMAAGASAETVANPLRWWYFFFDPDRYRELQGV